ncbi:MAG: glycerophosphoryl diester phosphodiesterase [Pelagibacterium sp. SCN 64-44]|nr:MAG: glycerophosphoryl diester phosphodiesterase [Pelagibacterium sp. SCN 64-44]
MSNHQPRSTGEVQAHRGASAVAPENTIAAFRAAHDQGARWVELDVALLADGTPVVIHDVTLDRTTNGKGPLGELVAADLTRLDAGSWFDPQFAGEKLSTLPQVLEALGELGLNVNVEIKQHEHHKSLAQLTETVHYCLQNRPAGVDVMISSFDAECLKAMHRLDPSYELAMLWSELPPDWLDRVAAIPAGAIHLHYRALSFNVLDRARENGLIVRCWTCNDPAQMAPFWDAGLGGVITDDPRLFL